MRRFILGVMTGCLAMLAQQTPLQASVGLRSPDDPSRAYWLEAQQLTQDQLLLLNRVETSLEEAEAHRLRSLRGQLFLHTWAIDRFLKSNYPNPSVFCASPDGTEVAGTDAVDLAQGQVYCTLYFASLNLELLRKDLNQRTGIVDARPLRAPIPLLKVPPKIAPAQSDSLVFNFPEGTIIGKSIQLPSAQDPVLPALSGSINPIATIQSVRQRLAQIQSAFPEDLRILIPLGAQTPLPDPMERDSYEARPRADFYHPATTISDLLSSEVYLLAATWATTVGQAGKPPSHR
ncbi:hypothetical protein [Myxacorys almedinensis]|nr:hypothetical protein [Myxacorys almedinensis]